MVRSRRNRVPQCFRGGPLPTRSRLAANKTAEEPKESRVKTGQLLPIIAAGPRAVCSVIWLLSRAVVLPGTVCSRTG